jgi:hypothetical protein
MWLREILVGEKSFPEDIRENDIRTNGLRDNGPREIYYVWCSEYKFCEKYVKVFENVSRSIIFWEIDGKL